MKWLKADLHTHTAEDPHDTISYSVEMLIDGMANLGYDVLAVTCHDRVVHSRRLAEFSRQRGILLVPGVELLVEGKHVVVLNPDKDQCAARTYSELRALGRRNAVILAPHPYYPLDHCLRNALVKNIDVFDAIEYSSVYLRGIGFNGRARRVAQRFGLPLVGTSDMHFEPFTDTTFTWIQAEPCVNSVVEAVREGRVRLDTRSCTCTRAAQMFWRTVRDMTQGLWTRQN